MSNNVSKSDGIGFVGVLTVAFIVLKLIGSITWSWWWVLSPIWITAILVVAFIAIIVGVPMFLEWRQDVKIRKRNNKK